MNKRLFEPVSNAGVKQGKGMLGQTICFSFFPSDDAMLFYLTSFNRRFICLSFQPTRLFILFLLIFQPL